MPESGRFIELGALAVYLVVLLIIGIRSSRQVKNSLDYTLAGRSVPWMILLATAGATMIGGGASVGMVSRVYEVGIAAAAISCAWHLQLIFVGLWAAPRLRGLNLITVGDYIGLKFGPLARELSVVTCILFLTGVLAAQMAAMGTVTNAILGIRYETALLIGASVTVFYSTVGGMRAVIKTDVLQFVILVVGITFASAMLLEQNGGFAAMAERAQAGQFALTSHWSGTRVLSLFAAFLLGEMFVPAFTVRCFVAKSVRQARLGMAVAGIFLVLFLPIATLVLGTAAQVSPDVSRLLAQEQERIIQDAEARGLTVSPEQAREQTSQLVFPALVRTTFHPALAGIIIAAIMAAVMSSADSNLSCLATVIMEDHYRRHINPAASDRQLLRVARLSTLAFGVGSAVWALFFVDITDILVFIYDFWGPIMIVPFLVGLFWYSPNRIYAVVIAMFAGLTATAVWRFALDSPGDLGPALFGFLVAVAAFLVSLPATRGLPLTRFFQPGKEVDLHWEEAR